MEGQHRDSGRYTFAPLEAMLNKLMQELVLDLKRKKGGKGLRISMVGLFHRTLSPMRPLRHRPIARKYYVENINCWRAFAQLVK